MNLFKTCSFCTLMILFISGEAAFARGAPVTPQASKDFKNFIVQGERPEIAACLASTLSQIKKNKSLKNFSSLEVSSDSALMREKELDQHLVRTIDVNARTILNDGSFFDSWTDIQIHCEQIDQGEPIVKIIVLK